MNSINYNNIVSAQLNFFNSNATKSVKFRIEQLKKLKQLLKSNETLLDNAVYKDFKKSSFENYATELSLIYHEINIAIKNLRKWSKKKHVKTNLANMPGKSYIIPEPLGVTLIIGAWNYPYQLSILPAVSAIAAGNTVIIKPSELAAATSNIMAEIINNNFNTEYLHVIEGGVEETTALLNEKFDKIFYTGSSSVGKIIMKAAAENLTPVTLELGGKSPAIVMNDADIKIAAQRITWAKFLNGGQTCVAPDYILVQKDVKQKLIDNIKLNIDKIYGDNPQNSEAFVRIINKRHFTRITELIDKEKVIIGGDFNKENLFISPTVMHNVTFNDDVMQEEIFGPVLPVIEFTDIDKITAQIKSRPKPLALYIFTSNKNTVKKVLHKVSFGGGAVNDAVMHLANSNLPFGGVSQSGIGNYHGKAGFDTFSHFKSILQKSTIFEPPIKYSPYTDFKRKLLRILIE
jgi:aldehyde dehydrogenase (NAD+)